MHGALELPSRKHNPYIEWFHHLQGVQFYQCLWYFFPIQKVKLHVHWCSYSTIKKWLGLLHTLCQQNYYNASFHRRPSISTNFSVSGGLCKEICSKDNPLYPQSFFFHLWKFSIFNLSSLILPRLCFINTGPFGISRHLNFIKLHFV